MALVNLKTDLKSLKFSEFNYRGSAIKPGPTVTEDINNPPDYNSVSNEGRARVDDLKRITTAIANSPSFTINQTALRAVDSQNKIKKALKNRDFRAAGRALAQSGLGTVKAIGSTLAQVPVNGTGTHFIYELKGAFGGTYLGKIGGPSSLDGRVIDDRGKRDQSQIVGDYYREQSNTFLPGSEESIRGELNPRPRYTDKILTTEEKKRFRLTLTDVEKRYLDDRLNTYSKSDKNINFVDVQPSISDELRQQFKDQQLIPFEIAVYDPKTKDADLAHEYLYFQAYLDSLNDNFTGNWSGTKYIGRAEELFTYSGFQRDFTFGFKVAADSKYELIPLYNKLNRLTGTTAPSYNGASGFMRGVYVKLTIGDYLVDVPGFFTSISLSWSLVYPWEIGLDKQTRNGKLFDERFDNNLLKVPHVLDISVGFTPVHDFNPEYGKQFFGNRKDLYITETRQDGKTLTTKLDRSKVLPTDSVESQQLTPQTDLGTDPNQTILNRQLNRV